MIDEIPIIGVTGWTVEGLAAKVDSQIQKAVAVGSFAGGLAAHTSSAKRAKRHPRSLGSPQKKLTSKLLSVPQIQTRAKEQWNWDLVRAQTEKANSRRAFTPGCSSREASTLPKFRASLP
jgi:hypothetical protein